jgi:hypothetical protein
MAAASLGAKVWDGTRETCASCEVRWTTHDVSDDFPAMEFWVEHPGYICAWLRLVVGIPMAHARAIETMAQDRVQTAGRRLPCSDYVFRWWFGENLVGNGMGLLKHYVAAIHDAVRLCVWTPSPEHIRTWTQDDLQLWASVILGLAAHQADEVAALIQTGSRLIDGSALWRPMAAPYSPVLLAAAQEFVFPMSPMYHYFFERLVRVVALRELQQRREGGGRGTERLSVCMCMCMRICLRRTGHDAARGYGADRKDQGRLRPFRPCVASVRKEHGAVRL